MPELVVDIGGRPGVDCRGFCEYCYFRHVKASEPFGCRYCPPFRVGCDYCDRSVKEQYSGFRGIREISYDVIASLDRMNGDLSRVTISGGGDPSCYPAFRPLVESLAAMEAPLHIGYTSGKGFDDPSVARFLVDNGLAEISFTVFSVDPRKRKKYMHDPTPEASLAVLDRLCGECDVYAAAVVLPGVNDGPALEATCAWLEDRGARGLILMRFANTEQQGLILGNGPLIRGQRVHTVEEFGDLVTRMADRYDLKISGTPLWDPAIGSPFAILSEPDLLEKLPRATGRATVVTGSVAAPFVRRALEACGFTGNVVACGKEIACLITKNDLGRLDLADLEDIVVIPGRAFVHDLEAARILSADGRSRTVVRGPERLTADGETSQGMNRIQVLELEMEGLAELIRTINRDGG